MSYTFSEPLGKLLSLDLSYDFSSRVIQCAFVFVVKNKVIYFQLSIVDNIQNLIKQYMHMKSYTLNKALTQDYCTTSTNKQYPSNARDKLPSFRLPPVGRAVCEKTINRSLDSPKSSFLSL